MFKSVKEFFRGETSLEVDSTGNPTSRDIQIATGVLLLEMAGSDEDYAPEEVQTIFRTLEDQFGVDQDEAMNLLEIADAARHEKGKIDEFIKSITQHFSEEQRTRVLAMVWKVIIADGQIDKFERRFAVQLQNRLQLTEAHGEQARQMAEGGKV